MRCLLYTNIAMFGVLCGVRDRTNPRFAYSYCNNVQQRKPTTLSDVIGSSTTNHVRLEAASPSNAVAGVSNQRQLWKITVELSIIHT